MVTFNVKLFQVSAGQFVEATLRELSQKHVDDFETHWKAALVEMAQEDKFWDWAFKQRAAMTYGNYECYAVEADERTQGLMMIETQWHYSVIADAQPLVYIEALSAAPWNRAQRQGAARFKRVGTSLLAFARARSEALGYGGRVGLHSLPGAEGFYESQHMMRCETAPDPFIDDDENPLAYFEYPSLRRLRS
ncbi:MAG: GNAT family N-acetyltransferase [Cyanobacteria bacterium J06648_11]